MPRKKKGANDNEDTEPAKKRGNPGDFHGKRHEYFTGRLDELPSDADQKTVRAWWPKFFKEYWKLFPWRLPIDVDPSDDMEPVDVDEDKSLSLEEKEKKAKIMDEAEAKIKRWFSYRRRTSGPNLWKKFLDMRYAESDDRRPRRLLEWQVYMQDPKKNAEINRLFRERHPDKVGEKSTLQWRAEIARELFAEEPEETKQEFRERGESEYKEALAACGKGLEGHAALHPGLSAEGQAEARKGLTKNIQPLLDAIRAHTGCHVTLIAGTVVAGSFDIRSVHSGSAKNANGEDVHFTKWDMQGYKDKVMAQFMRYLVAAEVEGKGSSASNAPFPIESHMESIAPDAPVEPSLSVAPAPVAAGAPVNPSAHVTPAPSPAAPVEPSTANVAPVVEPATNVVRVPSIIPAATSEPSAPPHVTNSTSTSSASAPIVQAGAGEGDRAMAVDDNAPAQPSTPVTLPPKKKKKGPLDGLEDISSPLIRQVEALTPGERAVQIKRLKGLSLFDRRRESNIAWGKEKLRELRIQEDVDLLLKGCKRQGEPLGNTKKRTRRSTGSGSEDEDEAEYEESDDNEEDEGGRAATPTPRAMRAKTVPKAKTTRTAGARRGGGARRGSKRAIQTTETDGGIPKWAADARVTLLAGGGGEAWLEVVELWWRYEVAANFEGPKRGAGTAVRPDEVSGWINRARSGGPHPAISDVYSFVTRWWKWWETINPVWRKRTGTPVRLEQCGDGDWSSLAHTGPNGLLNALICLRWWRDALRGNLDVQGWEEAVGDVRWVLQRVVPPAANEANGAQPNVSEGG
ncbi:hypothetical protein C8R43DRAFT_1136871 [Mycena crocata]|nr:hypothetical protein C8R43DRAFT_1136871 [Mycena crocata]